jgi:hypothetical protein
MVSAYPNLAAGFLHSEQSEEERQLPLPRQASDTEYLTASQVQVHAMQVTPGMKIGDVEHDLAFFSIRLFGEIASEAPPQH